MNNCKITVIEKKTLNKPEIQKGANMAACCVCPGSTISITYAYAMLAISRAAALAM